MLRVFSFFGRFPLSILAAGAVLLTVGCTSIAKRNLQFVEERAEKLRHLSSYEPTWCRVEVKLTEPAAARYAQMFPEESLNVGGLTYTWKASESRCEVTPLQKSKISENHKGFMEQAMCLLLHTHWINSPFDELKISPDNVEGSEKSVRLSSGSSPDLGVFLDRKEFLIETKTKSRGIFLARYASMDGQWQPQRIEHHSAGNTFVIDQFSYGRPSVTSRASLDGFWILLGTEQPFAHTQVMISDCRRQ